jgi:hypothetical protein
MDIGFTEEQELLRESARRFLESECTTGFVRARMAESAAVTDPKYRDPERKYGRVRVRCARCEHASRSTR